jgi:hypothetical protein
MYEETQIENASSISISPRVTKMKRSVTVPSSTVAWAAAISWAGTRALTTASGTQASSPNAKAAFSCEMTRFPALVTFHVISTTTARPTAST